MEDNSYMNRDFTSPDTRVTGLLHDRDAAKKVIDELKGAGFGDDCILVALREESTQKSFIAETHAQVVPTEDIANLPELNSEQVLIVVDAEDRSTGALNILNRNQAVTGGVRISQ
jgi:hypothetical protein